MTSSEINQPDPDTSQVSEQELRELAMAELDSVYRMALALSRRRDEAEELVQETYAKALAALPRFQLREQGIRPWLFRILHNVFYAGIERTRRAPQAMDFADNLMASEGDGGGEPVFDLASLDWEQVDERLKAALDRLDPRFREVLLLWSVEGMKYREIAEVLELPIGTIMSRLYRARAVLMRDLKPLAEEYRLGPGQGE